MLVLNKIVFLVFALFQISIYGYFIPIKTVQTLKSDLLYIKDVSFFIFHMNYLTHQLLNAEEINLIKKELEKENQQDWEDGKKTAGSHASMVKNNLQLK